MIKLKLAMINYTVYCLCFDWDVFIYRNLKCGHWRIRGGGRSGHGPDPVRQSGHKIGKIGATRCQILRLKCTKFDFRWGFAPDPGSAPDPAGGAYSAPPDLLAVVKGLIRVRGRDGGERGRKGKGEGRRKEW